jgi:hypothetical protein
MKIFSRVGNPTSLDRIPPSFGFGPFSRLWMPWRKSFVTASVQFLQHVQKTQVSWRTTWRPVSHCGIFAPTASAYSRFLLDLPSAHTRERLLKSLICPTLRSLPQLETASGITYG